MRKVQEVLDMGLRPVACLRVLKAEGTFDFSSRGSQKDLLRWLNIGVMPRGQN